MHPGGTQIIGTKDKKIDDNAISLRTQNITYTDNMCQEKNGRRGLASREDYSDVSIQELEVFIKKSTERLNTAASFINGNTKTDRKIT